MDATILEIGAYAAGLLTVGVLVGLMAGLLGVGGGAIMVIALYEFFGLQGVPEAVRMHLCVGTSLAVMIPTTLRSFQKHRATGAVDMEVWRWMGAGLLGGVLLGVLLARVLDGTALRAVFAVFCGILAARHFAAVDRFRFADAMPARPWLVPIGTGVGIIATLMGTGGGVFVTALMTLCGRSIHQAVATASGFGPLVAVPGAIGFIWAGWGVDVVAPGSVGYINLPGAALLAVTSVLAAPVGVRLAHGLSRRLLELIFAVFLALVATRFAISLLG